MKPFLSKRRTPLGNRLAAPLLFLTLALPLLAGAYQSYRCEQRNRVLRPVAQRALTLCTAFSDSCQTTGTPILWDEKLPRPGGKHRLRRLWNVECNAGGRAYALIFNALTGELSAIFAQGRSQVTTFQEPPALSLKTPSQALEASLTLLRQLKLVPEGSKIALAETPALIRHKEAWQVLWKVQRPESTQPTQIKLLIDRYSGVPVVVVNTHALDQTT